jgi:hypothetical protein
MATTQNGETEKERVARSRRVRVPGLLLISAAGDSYFIEGGIRANKLENLNLVGLQRVPEEFGGDKFPEVGKSGEFGMELGAMLREPECRLRERLAFKPRSYERKPASVEMVKDKARSTQITNENYISKNPQDDNLAAAAANLGPMLMQAYSVFLERDEASDGEITGNAHDLRMA